MATLVESDIRLAKLSLARECGQMTPVSERLRLYPGWNLIHQNPDRFPLRIAGTFGMTYHLPAESGGIAIAQAGFNLKGRETIIANSPQGFKKDLLEDYPEQVRKEALRELKGGEFRQALIGGIVGISKALREYGIGYVRGQAAANHPKVVEGVLPLETAMKSMDDLYTQMGFERTEDGDFAYRL